MTPDEFKSRAVPIYQMGPSEESKQALHELLDEAKASFPIAEVSMMAAEALDEAYPAVVALLGEEGSAAARMRRSLSRKGLN